MDMGVDINKETIALITYMRTDSITLSKDSIDIIRENISLYYHCFPQWHMLKI